MSLWGVQEMQISAFLDLAEIKTHGCLIVKTSVSYLQTGRFGRYAAERRGVGEFALVLGAMLLDPHALRLAADPLLFEALVALEGLLLGSSGRHDG